MLVNNMMKITLKKGYFGIRKEQMIKAGTRERGWSMSVPLAS